MNLKKQTKTTLLAILLTALLMTMVFAIYQYYLSVPSQWGVETEYGLELRRDGSKITAIDFGLVPRYGAKVVELQLVNIGNSPLMNVCISMPQDTPEYFFNTTFEMGTPIPKGSHYNFTIAVYDLDMDGSIAYNGTFAFWQTYS